MKKITKSVTEERTIETWVSFDEVEFDNEEACRHYEWEQHDKALAIIEKRAIKTIYGDEMSVLDCVANEMQTYYFLPFDNNINANYEIYHALQTVFSVGGVDCYPSKALDKAYNEHATVLVECYDNDSWYWYGTYYDTNMMVTRFVNNLFTFNKEG